MNGITVLSLSGEFEDLSNRTVSLLGSGAKLILRTEKLNCIREIARLAPGYETLDALYDQAEDFDALNERIAGAVIERAQREEVLYGVEDSRDESVGILINRAGEQVKFAGNSFSDAALLAMMRGPGLVLAAVDARALEPDAAVSTLIREIDKRLLASEVKLRLMKRYPDAHPIFMKLEGGHIITCPLYDLDRQAKYSHKVAALVPPVPDLSDNRRCGFSDLVKIVARLRAENGCPWDLAQTHESLRKSILEEAYEVCDAIEQGETEALFDELGDLLMLIVMQAQIGADHGTFGIDDVTGAACEKMIRRHPHIFGEAVAGTESEVKKLWEDVKSRERNISDPREKMMKITGGLPSLIQAEKVQQRAADIGFDFPSAEAALQKLHEELGELHAAIANHTNIEEEMGDLLFSMVNVSRLLSISAEVALSAANQKFTARFVRMISLIRTEGGEIGNMTLDQMDKFWDMIKKS